MTALERARHVIERGPGYVRHADGSVRRLAVVDVTALVAALKVRGTCALWPGECRRDAAATVLTYQIQDDPLLAEIERRVWWSNQRGLALRLYAAAWTDDTVALWTVPQPGGPTWPTPTCVELQWLHAAANDEVRPTLAHRELQCETCNGSLAT